MDFCIYDDILDTRQITDKKSLHFKLSKSGQILCVEDRFSQAWSNTYMGTWLLTLS